MKYCPNCQTTYADESLRFCLEDGTGLLSYSEGSQMPTQDYRELETVVRQKPKTTDWEPRRTTQGAAIEPQAKKSNTPLTIILTALVMSIFFGGLVIGWLLLKDKGSENKVSSNLKSPVKTSSPVPTPTKTNERDQNDNTDRSSDWEPIDYNASLNGERLTYYRGTTVEKCQEDCAANSRCVAFTLIRAGFYNPQDPPMCYLMTVVTSPSSSSCCISGIKKGVISGKTDGPPPEVQKSEP